MTGAARFHFVCKFLTHRDMESNAKGSGFSGPGTRVLKSERIFNQRIKKDIIDD